MAIEYNDLRGCIKLLENADCLKTVEHADWNLEIGTICAVNSEQKGMALLFDKIKDYPEGYRLLTNFIFQPKKIQRVAFGIPDSVSDNEVILEWRDKLVNYKPVPPVEVKTGPIIENTLTGNDIDLFKFPAPFWHPHDGGRYIGTGDLTSTGTRIPDM